LVRDASHINQCRQLLAASQEFCVIHSAFWSDAGIAQYEEEILDALRRGVHVYLLRGLGDDEPAGPLTTVERLRNEARPFEGELLVSTAPHHSHAKFVVVDGRSALVSSFNFLGATRDNPQLNIGLASSSAADPEQSLGRAVLRDLVEYALPGELLDNLERQLGRTELTSTIGATQPEVSDEASDPLTDFRDWFDSLREPPCAWEIVTSEAHRDALLIALHSARRTVTVTSGDMTHSAVDSVLRSYIQAAVERGVTVRFLWGSQTRDQVEQEKAAALAAEMHESLGRTGRFLINLAPKPVHAKLLIVDDWVSLVSSYNFLSYRGLRSGAHELGVKVYSRTVASQLEDLLKIFCKL
jgi:sugar-specific transcriptional regulator TrmB